MMLHICCRKFQVIIVLLLVASSLISVRCVQAESAKTTLMKDYVLTGVTDVARVVRLTGKNSINSTDKYQVNGTDLGSMFEYQGKIFMVFGDTFGPKRGNQTGPGGENWRSNVMAVTSDTDPTDGLLFDTMIVNEKGQAKELIAAKKINNDEITVIPTHGFAANGNMYLAFMSVKKWGPPGQWTCNYGGLAKSTDHGQTCIKLDNVKWPGDSNFIQVAPYKIDAEIYFWGIPAGRFGGVKLMKIREEDVEHFEQYQYFQGMNGNTPIFWSTDITRAAKIVEEPVGELSVVWNTYLQRWIMTYLNEHTRAIEIREGLSPWGPWGRPFILCHADTYPALYGAYMHPRYVDKGGQVIYFAMSQFGPYNVFWMKARLEKKPET
jgi:hypothetical protein